MKSWSALLLSLVLATAAITAHAQEAGIENESRAAYRDSLKGKTVVYIPMNVTTDLGVGWTAMVEKQAEELGYTVELRDPNWKTEAGARALTSAISKKPDLIVLQNPDVQSYAKLIKRAAAAGIKVIQLNMESLVKSDAYVGADWQGIGEMAGQAVAAHCAAGKGPSNKVQVVMGVPTGPADLYQLHGFRQALEDHPEIEIVSQQAANYDPTKARAITASVLQQHPDLCASFGIWDAMDAGTGAAIKEAGKQDQVFVVTSGGGSEASCEHVREGLFSHYISYHVPYQGVALNTMIAEQLQSDAPAGAESLVYYAPMKVITKETLTPRSCWTVEDLR